MSVRKCNNNVNVRHYTPLEIITLLIKLLKLNQDLISTCPSIDNIKIQTLVSNGLGAGVYFEPRSFSL